MKYDCCEWVCSWSQPHACPLVYIQDSERFTVRVRRSSAWLMTSNNDRWFFIPLQKLLSLLAYRSLCKWQWQLIKTVCFATLSSYLPTYLQSQNLMRRALARSSTPGNRLCHLQPPVSPLSSVRKRNLLVGSFDENPPNKRPRESLELPNDSTSESLDSHAGSDSEASVYNDCESVASELDSGTDPEQSSVSSCPARTTILHLICLDPTGYVFRIWVRIHPSREYQWWQGDHIFLFIMDLFW